MDAAELKKVLADIETAIPNLEGVKVEVFDLSLGEGITIEDVGLTGGNVLQIKIEY